MAGELVKTSDMSRSVRKRRLKQLEDTTLEKALNKIEALIGSKDPAIAIRASIWVAEMVLGKARSTEEIEVTQGAGALATKLRLTKEIIEIETAPPPEHAEGTIVLGEVIAKD